MYPLPKTTGSVLNWIYSQYFWGENTMLKHRLIIQQIQQYTHPKHSHANNRDTFLYLPVNGLSTSVSSGSDNNKPILYFI